MRFINVDKLVTDSIDMHMHPGLPMVFSRVNAIEADQEYGVYK